MSLALFIVAEQAVVGLDTSVNGKALGHSHNLDRLAKLAGVRPLEAFFSVDPDEATELFESLGGEPPAGGFAAEEWFAAEAGLTTVRGLLAHLTANPDATRDAAAVADDLRQFESVLAGLAAAGVRWHLAVDY